MEMAPAPSLAQAPKLGEFADQYPPEAGAGLAVGASLASLMPSISSHGEDYSAAARSGQPVTPGRGTSASALSPRTKGYAGGVTKSGKRRRRHPVAEIKGGWTLEEDARLKQLVETYGEGSWSKLVPYFSGRIGKQLRERWNHELRPDIQKGAWTEDEERALVEQHRIHRNAWADIARALPGRTCNAVKNHWNATLRRVNRGGQRTLQSPVEIYMDELGLIDTRNRNRPLHRTHNFHGNSRATGSGSMGPGSRDNAMRWLPELPPATKVPSAAAEPGAVSHPQAPLAVATEGLNIPSAPGMALSTPVMSAPAAILPAASTALSVNAAQPAIQLNPDQIAEKWGHPNGLTNHPEPQQEASERMRNGTSDAHDAPSNKAPTEPPMREPSPMRNGMEADKEAGSAGPAGGSRSKSPFPEPRTLAMSRGDDTDSDSDESDGNAETFRGNRDNGKRSRRGATTSRGQSTDPDLDEPGLRRSKRQRVSPQDDAFHFFNRTDADKEGQRKPHLEEAAMALLLLDVHSAPGKGEDDGDGLPRSARGRRMRPPSHRMDTDSSEDDEPPSPTVNIPRNARRRRTGWEGGSLRGPRSSAGHPSSADATPKEHPPKLRQVADMATQTPPLPQPALPPPLPPMRTSSGPDVKDAQTTLYGVNAAVASSRGANGKTVYASTVNVRDKVAGFIVGLAGMSDRWDKDASPALLRCRSGLGRSSDPKVVALRQAVLEKCMAFKGPSPNLAVAAMAALLAEMEPIVAAAQEAATAEDSGQGRYAGPGSIMGSSSRPLAPPTRPVQRATTHHFKSNPPIASVPPPAASVQAPPPGLNRAQMEAAMRALSNFPGLPLRPEMLVQAMANKAPPRIVTGHAASPRAPALAGAHTPRTMQGSASPLTALILPGLGGEKPGTPTAAASAANPTLAAAMAGMPLSQMLHMGPGMSGRHPGHLGPPGPSRLGSGLPVSSPALLPSSTTSLSLPVPAGGSGLTIRTTLAPGPPPPVVSPVMPVSTPSQGLGPGYTLTPPAHPSTASSSPALQSFLAAMTHPDAPLMPQASMQTVQLPGAFPVTAPMALPAQAFPQAMAAAPQQSVTVVQSPVVQSTAQAATPSSAAPAGF